MDDVLRVLVGAARTDERVRAVLLEGSRANPAAVTDRWQDYDVAFVTTENEPFLDGEIIRQWTAGFGALAVAQEPDSALFDNGHDPTDHYAFLWQFVSGLRIDATFETAAFIQTARLESATVVLLDKDGLFREAPPPSDVDFWVNRPSGTQFQACCNEFWWTVPYVAKAAARSQVIHALELLNRTVRPEFSRMLTWLAGTRTDFSVSVGKDGWDAGRFVPDELFEALLSSYPVAHEAAIRAALDTLTAAFPVAARDVAEALGFSHDEAVGDRVTCLLNAHF